MPDPVKTAENIKQAATGVILKGVGGLYTVFCRGKAYRCGVRGNLKRDETDDAALTAVISEVEPRKNCLERPRVANVDCLVLVLAAAYPAPDPMLADKLLVAARKAGIDPVLVINKADRNEAAANELCAQYKNAADCFLTDARVKEGIPELFGALSGRISTATSNTSPASTLTSLACG